ncbi:MAG: hypothetical protein DJ555_07555 [Desulfurococcaceae archaeon]|nr:MAG: hypothetical protein DJ555_07555 [Desulfurococcaceae archaeon]
MICEAEVYILEEPSSRDYNRVRRVCEKILRQCSYKIYDYSSIPGLGLRSIAGTKHCDAVINIKGLWVFVEITGRAEPADISKLDNTVELLSSIGMRDFDPNNSVRILHIERMDSITSRIVRSRKTYKGKTIIPMKCSQTLIESLREYQYLS